MFFSRLPAVRHCEDGEDRQRQLDIPEPDDVGRDDGNNNNDGDDDDDVSYVDGGGGGDHD